MEYRWFLVGGWGMVGPIDLAHEAPFDIGRLEVRPATRKVARSERAQVLQPRIMQVLVALARESAVGHVLHGSVRRPERRVRITVELIHAASGSRVWADRFDRDMDDIFALQDEIAQAIVASMSLKLLPEDKKAVERRGTTS